MDEKTSITDQIKETITAIKDRYVNPFALIVISYILIHNWKFFYILISDAQIPIDQRFKMAEEYWVIRGCGEIIALIFIPILLFLVGIAISSLSRTYVIFWNKRIHDRLVNGAEKYEIETGSKFSEYRSKYNSYKTNFEIIEKKHSDAETMIEELEKKVKALTESSKSYEAKFLQLHRGSVELNAIGNMLNQELTIDFIIKGVNYLLDSLNKDGSATIITTQVLKSLSGDMRVLINASKAFTVVSGGSYTSNKETKQLLENILKLVQSN